MPFASWLNEWCRVRDGWSKPQKRQVTCRCAALQELETRWVPAALSPVASFINTSGDNPYGPLIEDASGNLYGTTYRDSPQMKHSPPKRSNTA